MSTIPPALVVMGVTGCGKTELGRGVAKHMGACFIEADAHHPLANIEKMCRGIPLQDADRAGWLDTLTCELSSVRERGDMAVLACSALKRRYRDQLRAASPGLRFAFLKLSREAAATRVSNRPGHYMPVSLVDSQFADFEPPTGEVGVLTLDALQPLDVLIRQTVEWMLEPSGENFGSAREGA